jgi:hypothetical protein
MLQITKFVLKFAFFWAFLHIVSDGDRFLIFRQERITHFGGVLTNPASDPRTQAPATLAPPLL